MYNHSTIVGLEIGEKKEAVGGGDHTIARMRMHIYAQSFGYMSHLRACALGASCLFVLPVDDHVLLKKFLTKV